MYLGSSDFSIVMNLYMENLVQKGIAMATEN